MVRHKVQREPRVHPRRESELALPIGHTAPRWGPGHRSEVLQVPSGVPSGVRSATPTQPQPKKLWTGVFVSRVGGSR